MMASSPLPVPPPSLAAMASLRVARCGTPRTPEPMAKDDESLSRAPSPPRPRLKLKRRAVSAQHPLSAPTQHFLASVAAADIPIPSIEEPEAAQDYDVDMALSFGDIGRLSPFPHGGDDDDNNTDMGMPLEPRGRRFSIPKTPAPRIAPSLSPTRYPDWSAGSSFSSSTDGESSPDPDYSSLSRPSTSRSTHTNASLFSRLSHYSDFSPEPEPAKHLMPDAPSLDASGRGKRARSRRAPWTKAMSSHLWATYMVYLQDPRVTPFRTSKSCIPPHGVCLRVSRQAKKSWKGSKHPKRAVPAAPSSGLKSGSSTPIANATGTFIEWPHTCAATRKHLRDLCKLRAAAPGFGSGLRYMSRSPTPFVHAATRNWTCRTTPAQPYSSSTFAINDIALSLALSTSESMQPNGPLAQLASPVAAPESTPVRPEPMEMASGVVENLEPAPPSQMINWDQWVPRQPSLSLDQPRRLGSPFVVKSYGPSSTTSLVAAMGLSGGSAYTTRQLPHTVVGQRRATLQSPARFSSRAGMHKRRSTALAGGRASQYEMRRKRPSLGSDFWTDPTKAGMPSTSGDHVTSGLELAASFRQAALGGPSSSADPLVPRTTGSLESSLANRNHQPPRQGPSLPSTPPNRRQLAPPANPPPQLGSPFSMSSTSFSFPNRFFQPATSEASYDGDVFLSGVRNRSHSTVYASHQPSSSFTFGEGAAVAGQARTRARAPSAATIEGRAPGRDNLARRLAYIDERLQEFRSRDLGSRGPESPF